MKENNIINGIVSIFNFPIEYENQIKEKMKKGIKASDILEEFEGTKEVFKNRVMKKSAFDCANLYLGGTTIPKPFKYITISNQTGLVVDTDTKLQNENLRLEITNLYMDTLTGVSVVAECFVGTMEANFTWQQLGLVQGGTMEVNTGDLFSKVNKVIEKTTSTAKIIMWEIKFI